MNEQSIHKLIELKSKHLNVYVFPVGETFIACRQPTLSEINAVFSLSESFNMTQMDVWYWLGKICLVYGEPDGEAFVSLGEKIFEDINGIDDQLENFEEILKKKVPFSLLRTYYTHLEELKPNPESTPFELLLYVHKRRSESSKESDGQPVSPDMKGPPGFKIPNVRINSG